MTLHDRLGFDAGAARLEDALGWAGEQKFRYLDFNADTGPNRLDAWPAARVGIIREMCERQGVHIGLHTLSGVNVAELSPFVSGAVDEYLRAYVDLGRRLECEWIVVHAGYHFSNEEQARNKASLEPLKRITEYAEKSGTRLLLENLNKEPGHAEVHYLAHNVEECRRYFEAIQSPHLGWAFTVNHSHLVPEGIGGFLDAFGISRIGEVRLADNTGEYEVHLNPGQGTIDFAALFKRLERGGYRGHYSMAFGKPADKISARDMLTSLA